MSRFQIAIHPTEDETNIVKIGNKFCRIKTNDDKFFATSKLCEYQHVYILDKESECEFADLLDLVEPFEKHPYLFRTSKGFFSKNDCKEVIASTDFGLTGVPVIDDDYFLEAVVNKSDKIEVTQVNVNLFYYTCTIAWREKMIEHNLRVPSYENNKEKEIRPVRKQYLEWWDKLSDVQRDTLTDLYFSPRPHTSLIAKEIEAIWQREVKSLLGEDVSIEHTVAAKQCKPQVNFDLLKDSLPFFEALVDLHAPIHSNKASNLRLFFECMENPSFAHKASKFFQNS